ncbi:MAG: hypothetical protein M1825_003535 [Sarcosagium campestre]|nr:MAG: hypothetical protein M1825_003535 [Sarcosagium campestre]
MALFAPSDPHQHLLRRYMPHPQTENDGADSSPTSKTRNAFGVLRTILVPALASLGIYLLLSQIILPFLRAHRHRYNQYLPMSAISSRTDSLRHRAVDSLYAFFLPTLWALNRSEHLGDEADRLNDDDDSLFGDEEGEGMVGFDMDQRRREGLEHRGGVSADAGRRLSRDLEEGFQDDSDEETEATSTLSEG